LSSTLLEVFPYDLDRLVAVIVDGSYHKSEEEIRNKAHIKYLESYLAHIEAKTIVVEREYVDRDFLEDYAAYYVRCFPVYKKTCTRIHLFNESFGKDALDACLGGDEQALSAKALNDSYLGFMVIKPLPQTVIGRTCLTTYPATKSRSFPAARKAEFAAHLFGIPLKVPCSLPFQEQDSVVAACATSALWTVFQATARAFQHQLLSPIEITRAATHLLPTETRVIPNRGLSTQMMAHAIKSVNLEPLLIRVSEAYLLQSAIYSYVHAGIPLILGVTLAEGSDDNALKLIGKHALAVAGYSLEGKPTPITASGLLLRASRMDKIYVHDDQMGPFARMELLGHAVTVKQSPKDLVATDALTTSWPSTAGNVRAVPDMLLVPLYHKMRISWEWALIRVTEINAFLTQLTSAEHTLRLNTLEWDVYVTTVNEVRMDLRKAQTLPVARRRAAVTRPMPRFIWRATAWRDDEQIMDVLFDATDVDAADALMQVQIYDDFSLAFLQGIAAAGDPAKLAIPKSVRRFLSWMKENPSNP
jgi:hypothetical protein